VGNATVRDLTPGEYCRQLESYLCRKNDGHLIRIAGPSFEKVCGWAERGIPFKIACQGIDRYFDRYYARGPRRRPVRIEFCEADVLDAFDDWRRAVGIVLGDAISSTDEDAGEARTRSQPTLPAHLERVLLRLTSARADIADAGLVAAIDGTIEAVEALRGRARGLRGEARAAALAELERLDRLLVEAVRAAATPDEIERETREARKELAAFTARMSDAAGEEALAAAVNRALCGRAQLPRLRYD
jgi:hypothetical protein